MATRKYIFMPLYFSPTIQFSHRTSHETVGYNKSAIKCTVRRRLLGALKFNESPQFSSPDFSSLHVITTIRQCMQFHIGIITKSRRLFSPDFGSKLFSDKKSYYCIIFHGSFMLHSMLNFNFDFDPTALLYFSRFIRLLKEKWVSTSNTDRSFCSKKFDSINIALHQMFVQHTSFFCVFYPHFWVFLGAIVITKPFKVLLEGFLDEIHFQLCIQ